MPLASGGVAWSRIPPIEPGDTVVINGQGLVGNLYLDHDLAASNPALGLISWASVIKCAAASFQWTTRIYGRVYRGQGGRKGHEQRESR